MDVGDLSLIGTSPGRLFFKNSFRDSLAGSVDVLSSMALCWTLSFVNVIPLGGFRDCRVEANLGICCRFIGFMTMVLLGFSVD